MQACCVRNRSAAVPSTFRASPLAWALLSPVALDVPTRSHDDDARFAQLRRLLGERRGRSERRCIGDELGDMLAAAFSGDRRVADRRLG